MWLPRARAGQVWAWQCSEAFSTRSEARTACLVSTLLRGEFFPVIFHCLIAYRKLFKRNKLGHQGIHHVVDSPWALRKMFSVDLEVQDAERYNLNFKLYVTLIGTNSKALESYLKCTPCVGSSPPLLGSALTSSPALRVHAVEAHPDFSQRGEDCSTRPLSSTDSKSCKDSR